MKKSIIQTIIRKLIDNGSAYVPVKRDGHEVIRISNHIPTPENLFRGRITGKCKNVYLIFVKSMIDEKRQSGIKLKRFIQFIESTDSEEKIQANIELNNFLFQIGNEVKKGINYQIIDGNSGHEIEQAIDNAVKMLKTTVFVPLKYISTI